MQTTFLARDPARETGERWRRIELPSRAWHARTLPLSYHRKYEKRAAGIEPASTVWKTVALPLDDAREILFQPVAPLLPFYLRAARENCHTISCIPGRCPAIRASAAFVQSPFLEPASSGYKPGALPGELRPLYFDIKRTVERRGIEPRFLPCESSVLPLNYRPIRTGKERAGVCQSRARARIRPEDLNLVLRCDRCVCR